MSDLFITMIVQIDFSTILQYWSRYLWPERHSRIEPTSAMNYLKGYDLKNLDFEPTFLAFLVDDKIAGVNSGHRCFDGGYRSRGLYVMPEHRGRGIAVQLLLETVNQGIKERCSYVWSYPKLNSWSTYQKAGFILSSNFEQSELGLNAYCKKDI